MSVRNLSRSFIVIALTSMVISAQAKSYLVDIEARIDRLNMPADFRSVEGLQIGATVQGSMTLAADEVSSIGTAGPGSVLFKNSMKTFTLKGPLEARFSGGALHQADGRLSIFSGGRFCSYAVKRGEGVCTADGPSIASPGASAMNPVGFTIQQTGNTPTESTAFKQVLSAMIEKADQNKVRMLLRYTDGVEGGRKNIVLTVTNMTLREAH